MKRIALFCFLLVALSSLAQTTPAVSVIDFVKIKNGNKAEALYFYENNWKVYRDLAVRRGFIKSYRMLTVKNDASPDFDIICITEYSDTAQLKLSEQRFQEIIKETRPGGPKLLNDIQPSDFRQVVFSKTTETLFTSENKGGL